MTPGPDSRSLAALAELTIRRSQPADKTAIARLASLDSAPFSDGEFLLAEEGGELRAALPLAGGRALADPFHPTADLVAALELRAAWLRTAAPSAERRRGLRARSRRRLPAARAEGGLGLARGS